MIVGQLDATADKQLEIGTPAGGDLVIERAGSFVKYEILGFVTNAARCRSTDADPRPLRSKQAGTGPGVLACFDPPVA